MSAREKINSTLDDLHAQVGSLLRDRDAARAECEQLRVQLAGCGVAALDGREETAAKRGDYGWSASYQSVLETRRELDTARARIAELEAEVRRLGKLMIHRTLEAATPPADAGEKRGEDWTKQLEAVVEEMRRVVGVEADYPVESLPNFMRGCFESMKSTAANRLRYAKEVEQRMDTAIRAAREGALREAAEVVERYAADLDDDAQDAMGVVRSSLQERATGVRNAARRIRALREGEGR